MSQLVMRHLIQAKDGHIIPYDSQSFKGDLIKLDGKDLFCVLESIYKQRSIPENRYLFGVIIKILRTETEDFGGWNAIEVYRWLEWKFLNDYPETEKPEPWKFIKELSTVNFEELMDRIREWAAVELGCYIPLPNEVEVLGEPITY